jgi:hypothetical protein
MASRCLLGCGVGRVMSPKMLLTQPEQRPFMSSWPPSTENKMADRV